MNGVLWISRDRFKTFIQVALPQIPVDWLAFTSRGSLLASRSIAGVATPSCRSTDGGRTWTTGAKGEGSGVLMLAVIV